MVEPASRDRGTELASQGWRGLEPKGQATSGSIRSQYSVYHLMFLVLSFLYLFAFCSFKI